MSPKPPFLVGYARVSTVEAIKAVEAILPGHAIALVAAPFGAAPGRRANYVGNGDRADIRALLKEVLARWEGRHQEAPGRPQ
jgi:hypothetical protein